MKRPGIFFAAAGLALALGAAACSGGAPSSSSGSGSAAPAGPVNRTFTYDTFAPVMDDGWDPATEYSDAIIAMSQMYETLTRYDTSAHRLDNCTKLFLDSTVEGHFEFRTRHVFRALMYTFEHVVTNG